MASSETRPAPAAAMVSRVCLWILTTRASLSIFATAQGWWTRQQSAQWVPMSVSRLLTDMVGLMRVGARRIS